MHQSDRCRPALFLPVIALSLALLSAASATPAAAAGPSLTSIGLTPEGRLLKVTVAADIPLVSYSLARQGPPEKRDLVLRLPGGRNGMTAPVDTGDFVLPIDVRNEGEGAAATLIVSFSGVGDALVRVAQEGERLSLLLIPPERHSDVASAYRIGANDVLQVDVFGHDDLSKTLKVSPRGSINFPLIGTVPAEGRTVDEVAGEITERLGKDYLQDPRVVVSVWEYLSQWVNVIGEVAQPGRFYMTGPTTLIDALTQAGGLAPGAGSEILITRRPEEVDPASAGEVLRVDVKGLFGDEGGRLNHRLRAGDTVNVPGREAAPPRTHP